MAERFSLKDELDVLEVELADGYVFAVKELTKHLEQQLGDLPETIGQRLSETSKGEEFVKVIGQYLDVVLRPIETNGDGPAKSKPSTLLKKAWNADELSAEKLTSLFLFIRGVPQGPPT